ncbi:protein obstructor-E-like [Hyposmocoma kahamanoa]|uniref:protein obstructor-E-like n=1 Tax=Hyposmocoma kahamanoa TaxID=1477025 RepID=UPI000E6D7CDC|nr:protein obstructor-E-like [Hyposmocoma kahamanoa]
MEFICPDGLYFNPEAKWQEYPCADPATVVCKIETTTTPSPPIDVPQPLPHYKCPDENNYYAIEDLCKSFIECKQFSAMKFSCPDNLLFDPEVKWPKYPCNDASEVRCGPQPTQRPTLLPPRPTPPPKPIIDPFPYTTASTPYVPHSTSNTAGTTPFLPTPKPVKPTPPLVPEVVPVIVPNYICAEENRYYTINRDCGSYIECKKYVAYGWKCPDGLHFNIDARYPDYPCASPSVAKCGKLPEKVDPAHGCPLSDGYFGLQDGDCSRYLMCKKGQSQIMHCPDGLVFNDKLSSCDWLENVPSCNPTVFQGFSCPVPELNEHGQLDDTITKYRYGTRCKEYIACQRGYPRLLSCDAGLSFDNESKACTDSRHVTNCE